jgi:aspartyl-tRNA(Asn)/glutamyl-tRNA(Gln) amidotransferase subunit C
MSRISRSEVQHIAHLARLSLSDDEVASMARDLDQILEYVDALRELDTEGIEPTAHAIPLAMPLRADEAEAPMDPSMAVANAPESVGTAFVVPRVIESEDEG